ncbi:hypothetical protein FRC06_004681 [Ceratobasidium sp. 370]|nr:hypothetical protein FRC06_004681 [Ceratobasidium sp. 370]
MRTSVFVSLAAFGAALTGVGAAPAIPGHITSELKRRGLFDFICPSIEIRREWRSFSKAEKAAYIAAVNCLGDKTKNPHSSNLKPQYPRSNIPGVNPDSSLRDDMTYLHMDQTDHIHYTGAFLLFHRWFTNMHVRLLKDKCGYKGVMPYWDWSQDTASFNTSAMWDPDPTSGLGTFGDPNNDYYVKNGGFANLTVAYPIPRPIRRQYTPYPYLAWWWVPRPQEAAVATIGTSFVDAAINGFDGNFIGFQNATEKAQAFHANIHMIMGGDMAGTCPAAAGSSCQGGSTWTPNDPMFYLHHANIDRIWWKWQWQNPISNLYAFKGGSNMTYSDPAYPNGYPPWMSIADDLPTDGLFPEYNQPTVYNMLNTLIGPDLCYIYA